MSKLINVIHLYTFFHKLQKYTLYQTLFPNVSLMWCDLLSREQSGLVIGALELWLRSEGMELNLT